MNKEVIYLEPEDDITDILTKLQRAEQKLVALVPPKKATILRSAVNMKLVAKAAKESKKVAVIVTADPAIMKLAMSAKIPVAKTLQSRPVVPTAETLRASEAEEQVIDEELGEITDETASKTSKTAAKMAPEASESASERLSKKSANTIDLTDEALENDSKNAQKGKKADAKAKDGPKSTFLAKYRKWVIAGSALGVLLIIVLVWALVFAPAVSIVVAISTSSSNFSENIRFTTDINAENLAEGIFYADQRSYEHAYTSDFTATGRENHGDKATGTLTVSIEFRAHEHAGGVNFGIPAGTRFSTTSGLEYATTEDRTLAWSNDIRACGGTATDPTCSQGITVPIAAVEAGEESNLPAGADWASYTTEDGITVRASNSQPIDGGTTDNITVVSQEDLDKVKESQISEHTTEGKERLLTDLPDDVIPIESSFKTEATKVESTPELGAEVKSDSKPSATVTLKFFLYTVDKARVEEYVKAKTPLPEGQKIYSIGDPYIERFTSLEETARLKTVVETGPTVTEEEILERSKGHKIGEVRSLLRSIDGVSSVEITPSFFWVSSVPNDPNKVTIEITVEGHE